MKSTFSPIAKVRTLNTPPAPITGHYLKPRTFILNRREALAPFSRDLLSELKVLSQCFTSAISQVIYLYFSNRYYFLYFSVGILSGVRLELYARSVLGSDFRYIAWMFIIDLKKKKTTKLEEDYKMAVFVFTFILRARFFLKQTF